MRMRIGSALGGLLLTQVAMADHQLILHNQTRFKIHIAYTLQQHAHVLYANPQRHVADVPAANEQGGAYQIKSVYINQSPVPLESCVGLVWGQPYAGVTLYLRELNQRIDCQANTN